MNSYTPDIFSKAIITGNPLPVDHVIDVHGHLGATDCAPNMHYPLWQRDGNRLVEAMRKTGVKYQVFSHFHALIAATRSDLRNAQEKAVQAVEDFSDTFRAYAVMNPKISTNPNIAFKWVDRYPDTFLGVKVHGEIHEHRLLDERMQAFWSEANIRQVPVLLHVNPLDGSDDLARFMEAHPALRIILAHLWPWQRPVGKIFKDFPGIFTDTSLSYNESGRLEDTVELCGGHRVIFGSDSAYLEMGAQVAKVALSKLSQDQKSAIFRSNSEALFPVSIWTG